MEFPVLHHEGESTCTAKNGHRGSPIVTAVEAAVAGERGRPVTGVVVMPPRQQEEWREWHSRGPAKLVTQSANLMLQAHSIRNPPPEQSAQRHATLPRGMTGAARALRLKVCDAAKRQSPKTACAYRVAPLFGCPPVCNSASKLVPRYGAGVAGGRCPQAARQPRSAPGVVAAGRCCTKRAMQLERARQEVMVVPASAERQSLTTMF